MPTTPVYAFPYPSLSDSPNGPAQFQALAEAVENKIVAVDSVNSTQSSDISTLQSTVNLLDVRNLGGRIAATVGVINAGINTTEVNISKLGFTPTSVTINRVYVHVVTLSTQFSAGNDSFVVRVRKDTALSGTIVFSQAWISQVAGFTHDRSFIFPWIATATDASADFFVSLQRVAGTGTCDVNGSNASSYFILEMTNTSEWVSVP
jgi:hypothetical protein